MRLMCVITLLLCPAGLTAATLELERGQVGEILRATVQTAHYSLTIDASTGARVMSLLDRASGRELVRGDDSGLGGLLEDRPLFSAVKYAGRVVEQTRERIRLAFSVRNEDGIALVKAFTFTEERSDFTVSYEIENGSQLPFTLWVRNFATPVGADLTEQDHVFLRHAGALQELTFPDGYYPQLDAPWMCLLNARERAGFFVRCDFDLLDRFYFWSHSRVIPTFEWIYRPVPPGMKTATGLRFGLVSGVARAGHVDAEGVVHETAEPGPERRVEPRFTALEGWQPVEDLYGPSDAERARGFIVTTGGTKPPRARLETLEVDLGRAQRTCVPVEVFALAERAQVTASVTGPAAAAVTVQAEREHWLVDEKQAEVTRGHYGRLWLTVNSTALAPGEHAVGVMLDSGAGAPVTLPLTITVWDVHLPPRPNFGIQMYAFLPTLSAYELDEAARERLAAHLDGLQMLRVDHCDWAVAAHYPAMRATVAGSGEPLSDWSKARENVTVNQLPDIEFGHYDPWFDEPLKRGMTRFLIHVSATHNWREASVVRAALGREADPNTEEGWEVVLWFYTQLRRYAAAKGFREFWAKIDDEIPQEHIPTWNEAARRYQSIGYRTFTTNTGNIARSATLLSDMNETSDAWQVALPLSRDFMDLTRRPAAFEHHRAPCELPWAQYTNGGAVDTWATRQPFFAGDRPQDRVDEVQVHADGTPLAMRDGSGWGNKDRGVAHMWAGHIYVALPDGGDPNDARIEVAFRLRAQAEAGEPPVRLKDGAQVWYYGGGSHRSSYEASRAYAWRMCAWQMAGYGYWTYLWWNDKDILVRYEPDARALRLSPAFEGLRDGNEDAAYFRAAEAMLQEANDAEGMARLRALFGPAEEAPLRLGEVRREVYSWEDFTEPTFAHYNRARRTVLQVLAP